jgi:prepilin-type N-terminal cleavage/methylation domain-containing protein
MTLNCKSRARGFSMVELLVAMAVGLVVVGAGTQLFQSAMKSTMLVTEQAEMQQNVRTALNLVARDVSMAGSGLPSGGLALPYGANSTPSHYACAPGPTCYLNAVNYPSGAIGRVVVSNYMYGIIPGPLDGMQIGGPAAIPATNVTPDAITSVYVDYSFPLNQYTISLNPAGTSLTATPPAVPPVGFPAIVSPTGIVVGDLILLTNSTGSAIGEVSAVAATGGGGGTITFNDGDPLNINQSGAASGNIAYIAANANAVTVAYRVLAVTYFVQVPAVAGQTPRLMRQVNGQVAIPVADNIIGLNATYDLCNSAVAGTCAGVSDPIHNVPSFSPNQIYKINIQIMGQSVLTLGGKSQSMALATSVSARNLSFKNRYQ